MSQRSRQRRDRRLRNRRLWIGAAAGAVIVTLVAAGAVALGESGDGSGRSSGTSVALSEYAFDPDPIEISADDPSLEVENVGAIAHNLLVSEVGRGTPELDPGESYTLELDGIEPGSYSVVCDLTGHREAGMVAELVVR